MPAQEVAIAIIYIGLAGRDLLHEAVSLHVDALELCRQLVADEGASDATFQPQVIIIAVGRCAIGAKIEAWLFRDDVQEAGTGIASEQGALRAAQNFDAFHLTQFRKTDACAAAINAVNEQRDGRFKARIFADRANAADTGSKVGLAGCP